MKKNINLIATAVVAIILGLLMGYLFFGGHSDQETNQVMQSTEAVHTAEEAEVWTCSMHPQVRQKEPGECPICEMDLIPLAENRSQDPLILEMTAEAVKLASIQTTVIEEHSTSAGKQIRLSGKVQADERRSSSQVAHLSGRIEKLWVTFTGEQVSKGQKLADLYAPEMISAQRELLEALKLKDLNPDLVEAARNKLRFWKIEEADIQAIEKVGIIHETFPLYALESGVVTQRRVSVGDYVKQGDPLFDLMNLGRVWVLFDAFEEDLGNIKLGDRIEFKTPALSNKKFKTRVTFIDPIINPGTRATSVRAEVGNSAGLLKPEMLVYGVLQGKSLMHAQVRIPKTAILWTGRRSVVYIKLPDTPIPSFQFREIELGERLGEEYQVLSGVEPGEEIVTYGSFSIDAAAQLNNQVSMMNRNVMLKGADHKANLPDYTGESPDEFKKQLALLSEAYLDLKDALVKTSNDQAASAASKVNEALVDVDMSLLEGTAHMYWMDEHSALESHSKKISELMDVEKQREQFDFLSQAMIRSVKVFGVIEDTLFVQHCPMASRNQGAEWLSRESEVMNPYFGDMMLKCGFIKDTIDKNFKNAPLKQTASTPRVGHVH
ncbi:MAG: efflux RND transporter periplasmic adaptor subunit [Saprospiraceae bacterium]|nr:efflux RND transporter periplasmic adaptor subunit [Saprospiraceae bacterium]